MNVWIRTSGIFLSHNVITVLLILISWLILVDQLTLRLIALDVTKVTWLLTELISIIELPECAKLVHQNAVTIVTIPVTCVVTVTLPLITSTELTVLVCLAMVTMASTMIWVTWDAQTVPATKCGTVQTALVITEPCGTTIPWCVKETAPLTVTTNQRDNLAKNQNQDLS